MLNIVYFNQIMSDLSLPGYKLYETLYNQQLLNHPVIYTDKYNIKISHHIPVFATYYLRHCFNKNYILVDYPNLVYVPSYLHKRCIIVYNKLFHAVENLDSYFNIEVESDGIQTIKDKLYEKV